MSWMSEKKAKEIFELYWKAEKAGQHEKATELEKQLKDAGYKITVGPTGTTVVKIQKGGDMYSDLSDYLPKESNNNGYRGGNDNKGSKTNAIIISVSIGVGIIGLIVLIVYLAKNRKNVGLQTG